MCNILGANLGLVMNPSTFLKDYWQNDSGATAVEYALVITTLSIVIVSAMVIVGRHTANTWNTISDAVNGTD
jgi:Flp pilus assembly pilin Flp